MISNVTKSADILRGATEWQDLWAEVEKELPVKGLPPPRVLQNEIMIGKVRNEQERREELERLAHTRQQRTNFYQSDSAKALKARKSSMTPVERKTIQSRLTRRTASCPAKPKSVTNLGFVTGEHHSTPGTRLKGSPEGKPIGSPQKKEKGGVVPKSKAGKSDASERTLRVVRGVRPGQPRVRPLFIDLYIDPLTYPPPLTPCLLTLTISSRYAYGVCTQSSRPLALWSRASGESARSASRAWARTSGTARSGRPLLSTGQPLRALRGRRWRASPSRLARSSAESSTPS